MRFAPANTGWQRAPFQEGIFYIPRDEDNGTGVWASLTKLTTPSCYSIDLVPSSEGGDWGTYFFFGGPGATAEAATYPFSSFVSFGFTGARRA